MNALAVLDAPLPDRLAWLAGLRPIEEKPDPRGSDLSDGWEPRKARRVRRPSLKTIIRQAKAAGARSITTRDGHTINLRDEPQIESREENEWDRV